jgi:probable FeS assembly SUF system protein SufT
VNALGFILFLSEVIIFSLFCPDALKTSPFELVPSLHYPIPMHEVTTVLLKRECEAVQIPAGNTVTLPQGLEVDITQTLGGSITVRGQGALFRIAPKDADALGLSLDSQQADTNAELTEPMIWEALKTCYDPEIPVNIVDLGLVYDMATEGLPNGNRKVFVKMTLTAPGCGMGPTIARDAQQKLLLLPKVEDAVVEIVWDPPWHQSMITEDGRRILGLE